jgi:hypothetical protein
MANDIKITIKALTSGTDQVNALAGSIDSAFKRGKLAMDAFNAATGNGKKIITNMQTSVKDLVGAYLSLAGAKAMFTGMVDILKKGEQAQFAMTASVQSANREFQNVGSVQYWEESVKELSKELVVYSESSLKGAISRTIDMTKRLGLSADQMKVLISRTGDLSAGKTDLEGGIERVTAAMRGEAEASEYLGLTLNENYVKAWYEAHEAHEKAWKDLTDLEKAQVRYQIFLEQTNSTQGRAAKSAQTFQGALALVDKAIEDAVNNNQDLAESMAEVAEFIRENANSIGEMASQLIQITADVAKFALEWKEVLVALAGLWGVVKSVSLLTTVIKGLSVAMATLRAAGATNSILAVSSACNQATIAGLAFSTWMRGALVLAAGYATAEIMKLVHAYMEMKHWENEAREANKERLAIEDRANEKARELGKALGVNVGSLSDFNRLVKEGKIVWDAQTGAWKLGTEVAKKQAQAVELSEEKLKDLKDTLGRVGEAYQVVSTRMAGYYDFAAGKAKALTSDERQAALDTLDIYRQKTESLLQLAQQEADRKQQIIAQSGGSEQQQAEQSKQIAEDLKNARIKTLQDWESKLQSSLLQAISEEQKYAAEVLRLQQDLAQAKMSTEEKVRELRRRTMTEEAAWIDKQKQAYETLRQAQQAIANAKTPDQLKAATDLAKKAQEQFANLAGEVKEGDQVIKTESETTKAAIKGVEEAGKLVNQSIEKQIQLAKDNRDNWQNTASEMEAGLKTVKEQIDTINNTPIVPEVNFKIDQSSLSDVERVREALSKPITVSVNYVSSGGGGGGNSSSGSTGYTYGDSNTYEGSAAEKYWMEYYGFRLGGLIRKFADGGFNRLSGLLPGFGGGDRVRALLEDGEFIIRKEAVKKYGTALFQALNGMRFNIPQSIASAMPTLPELPKTAFATGGSVSSSGDYGTLRLQAGGVELPVMVQGRGGRQMVKEFEKELKKLKLTQGR